MELVEYQEGKVIAGKNEKVKFWYLVQKGAVIQKTELSQVRLERNSIIGFPEKDINMCEYVAAENTVLAAFKCDNSDDLKRMLAGKEKIRNIFLRAAVRQRHQLICLYSDLYNKARQYQVLLDSLYNDYRTICSKYRIEEQGFSKMERFRPLQMKHKAEMWEVNNSISIVKNYLQDYLQLMEKDDSLTVGAIMEAAAQMRRFTMGIGEIEDYLSYNKGILISESNNDIFKLYFDLAIEMYDKKFEITPVKEKIDIITAFAGKFQIYNNRMVAKRVDEFNGYDYAGEDSSATGEENPKRKEIDITKIDCVSHILQYAGYEGERLDEITQRLAKFRGLPDMMSADGEAYSLRKKISADFYEIYYKVFMRAVEDEDSITTIIEMFLNFGFMDVSYIGEDKAKELYDLCSHLDICLSDNVYTIYEWLKRVYRGEKETSKNEFDQNFQAYLLDMYKRGEITQEQAKQDVNDCRKRIEFEIKKVFKPINKMTYGRISTFCPVLNDNDMVNSVDKMLVTADKLEEMLNEIRKIDFSVFYREVQFSAPDKGIANESVMREILPDIILMPNAGSKAMMWQETAGVKSDTPARFMFPIFTLMDLQDMMLEVMGRYRWEMCRKLGGIRWNDVREKSLTAEYCSYIQFYRKNSELSTEAKEKIKSTLQHAKNSYREVFVKDYISLIKFEAKGGHRLNKVSRDILVRYCPFVKSVRDELRDNPTFQQSISRYEADVAKKKQRYEGLYTKYEKAGGENGSELKETILYYDM